MFELMPFEKRHDNFLNYMDALDKSFFGDVFEKSLNGMRTDIRDEGDHYILEAELPGFEKEDIKLRIESGQLVVSAFHKEEKEDKKDKYLHKERYYGSYERRFDLEGINPDNIKAAYKNGVLELTLPKAAGEKAPVKQIEIL